MRVEAQVVAVVQFEDDTLDAARKTLEESAISVLTDLDHSVIVSCRTTYVKTAGDLNVTAEERGALSSEET